MMSMIGLNDWLKFNFKLKFGFNYLVDEKMVWLIVVIKIIMKFQRRLKKTRYFIFTNLDTGKETLEHLIEKCNEKNMAVSARICEMNGNQRMLGVITLRKQTANKRQMSLTFNCDGQTKFIFSPLKNDDGRDWFELMEKRCSEMGPLIKNGLEHPFLKLRCKLFLDEHVKFS